MNVFRDITALVGNTPLLQLEEATAESAAVLAKLEYLNPAGSVKDRVALSMIEDAEQRGLLQTDSVIIEPTSGNTGIGLAAIAAVKGYRVILTMPATMSSERIALLKAYGAEVVLTDGKEGMAGAVAKANELAAAFPHAFIPDQFGNPQNPAAHVRTTGPEIWNDTDGAVDIFVAGVGTGGTLSGVGRYLKAQKPSVEVVAVEPAASPLLSTGKAGSHGLQGIGANFVPDTLDTAVIDRIITVTEENAYAAARRLARTKGVLAGISSGAALHAAYHLAALPENRGKTIVVLLPDTGDRYLSTALFEEDGTC